MYVCLGHTLDVARVWRDAGTYTVIASWLVSFYFAARKSSGLVCLSLFFPITSPVLAFFGNGLRLAILMFLAGAGMFLWAVLGLDSWASAPEKTTWEKLQRIWGLSRKVVADERAKIRVQEISMKNLEGRKAAIREWQRELENKKASLDPNDPREKAVFDAELARYMEALENVKSDLGRGGR